MVGQVYFQEVALYFSILLLIIPWLILIDQIKKIGQVKIYFLLFLGLLTRLLLAPFFGHSIDIQLIQQDAVYPLLQGKSPYFQESARYPPLFYYTEALMVILAGDGVFYFKLPIIVSEVILGFVIYKMSCEYTHNERLAYWASAIFLLDPVTYFQTAIFGHFDIIPTLFMVLAIYLLVKDRFRLSALSLGIGIMFKLFPIVLLPVIFLYLIRLRKNVWRLIIEYIAVVVIFCTAVSLPYLILNYDAYMSVIFAIGGTRGLSIYRILFYFVYRAGISTSERFIGTIILGMGSLITLLIFITREVADIKFGLLEESTFFLLIFLLLNRYLFDQYLVWTIPFLISYFLVKPASPQLGDMILYYCYTCAIMFHRVVKWRVWFSLYDDFSFVFFSTFALSILFFNFIGWLIAFRFFSKQLPNNLLQSFKEKLSKWLCRSQEINNNNPRLRSYMSISSFQIDFSIFYVAIIIGMIIVMFIFQGKTDISFEMFLLPIILLSVVIAALIRSGLLISGIETSSAIYTFINFWIVYIFEVGIYFHSDLFTILVRAFLVAASSSIGYILVSLIENFKRRESLIDLLFR